jgi:hypothetical protein
MLKRTTIPKNRVGEFLTKVTEARVYTLDNYFRGEPVTDLAHMRDWAVRLSGKVRIVKETRTGQIHYHSNHWVDFNYQD